jgi:hypothetical protein
MGNPARVFAGVLILAALLLAGCHNPLNPPHTAAPAGGLVRIVIGGGTARTVQPAAEALAGYRLAFSGGHDPVDIATGNSANVYLADGTYTITATAYKAGGQIGNDGDAAASGAISVTLSDGSVDGGVVPPIILGPLTGTGSLRYAVTAADGVSGTLRLWNINGTALINEFDGDGILEINDSVDGTEDLAAGRYIAEIKLADEQGKVAFLREVIELWPGLATDLVFEPDVYLDPSLVPANSGAALSTTSAIGGAAIGTGTGSGEDEANAVSHVLAVQNIANAPQNFVLEHDSLGAVLSWTATAGDAPGETGYSNAPIANFSTNNVLWVKVVSEDTATTRRYKFTLYPPPPSNGGFTDTDTGLNEIGGNIAWTVPDHTAGISGYRIYFGSVSGAKLGDSIADISNPSTGSYTVPADTTLPTGAKNFLIYPYNSGGNDYPLGLSIPIQDITFNAAYGDFRVKGIGNSNASFVSWSDPVLTISGSGDYYIAPLNSDSSLAKQIVALSDAGIVLEDVNLDLSAADDAAAFEIQGASVNLTLLGTNTLKSGKNKAGLQVPEGSSLTITAASSGSLEAEGGEYGAGIGGGYNNGAGAISVKGGMVIATGGQYAAGIGGRYGAGSIGEISGNAMVFASSIQPTLTAGDNATQAIVFNGTTGTVYGSVTLQQDLTIPAGSALVVLSSATLTVNPGKTLTNNGLIYVETGGNIIGTITGKQPQFPFSVIDTGNGSYDYAAGLLTITGDGTYTISMRNGTSVNTYDRIVVNSGVTANITFNGINIDMSNAGTAAFDMRGATVQLTLIGTNVLKSSAGAGLQAPEGSTLTINAANATHSLSATGGPYYAGIGGGGTCGTITINGGTVTATGGTYYYSYWGTVGASGAGIGGGSRGNGGTITINGGIVTATGGERAAGIGGGYYSDNAGNGGTITEISGNAVVFASSIQPVLLTGSNLINAIVIIGDSGTMYDDVTLQEDITIPSDKILGIPATGTLTIPPDRTLTNNGNIYVYTGGVINGNVSGNEPVYEALTVTGDSSYTNMLGIFTITGDGSYAIGMKSGVSVNNLERIVVAAGVTANITLNGVNIDVSGTKNTAAFDMTGATITHPDGNQYPEKRE